MQVRRCGNLAIYIDTERIYSITGVVSARQNAAMIALARLAEVAIL